MGFGSTAKKLQKVTEMADKLYERFEQLREQVKDLTETVEETSDRVEALEGEVADQRALLEALAEHQGVDVDAALADATGDTHSEDGPAENASQSVETADAADTDAA
jgi:chromosome segregation ATPase